MIRDINYLQMTQENQCLRHICKEIYHDDTLIAKIKSLATLMINTVPFLCQFKFPK